MGSVAMTRERKRAHGGSALPTADVRDGDWRHDTSRIGESANQPPSVGLLAEPRGTHGYDSLALAGGVGMLGWLGRCPRRPCVPPGPM